MKPANRTFIVSGGCSGLGEATVHRLYDAGAYVSILDLNENSELLGKLGKRGRFFRIDITKNEEVEEAVEGTVRWTKEIGASLGGVVNCAGVSFPGKIIDARGNPHNLDHWNFVIAVNLTGSFNLTRLVCKHLVQGNPEGPDNERGVVIFVSSSAAFEGQPGQASYSASKGALNSLTLPLARDLARHGIRVNTIAPGVFKSAMTDKMPEKTRRSLIGDLLYPQRFGVPDEFASTAMFLIDNSFMNGEVIRLSGGARLPAKL